MTAIIGLFGLLGFVWLIFNLYGAHVVSVIEALITQGPNLRIAVQNRRRQLQWLVLIVFIVLVGAMITSVVGMMCGMCFESYFVRSYFVAGAGTMGILTLMLFSGALQTLAWCVGAIWDAGSAVNRTIGLGLAKKLFDLFGIQPKMPKFGGSLVRYQLRRKAWMTVSSLGVYWCAGVSVLIVFPEYPMFFMVVFGLSAFALILGWILDYLQLPPVLARFWRRYALPALGLCWSLNHTMPYSMATADLKDPPSTESVAGHAIHEWDISFACWRNPNAKLVKKICKERVKAKALDLLTEKIAAAEAPPARSAAERMAGLLQFPLDEEGNADLSAE